MKILQWLWFWKKNTLTSLGKQSESIFDVFTKTKVQALKVNEKIAALLLEKEEQIKALQSEASTLTSMSDKNAKLAGKIDAFLSE